MKFQTTLFFIAGLLHACVLCADDNSWDSHFVEGEVVWIPSVENKMRDNGFTNVFHSITTNGFIIKALSKRFEPVYLQGKNPDNVFVQQADFQVEGGNILFNMNYYTTTNKLDGGRWAMYASTYMYSTMMDSWFKQYMDGPGNLCLLPKRSDMNAPSAIKNVFFCRDNVAVRVQNYHGGDVLAFVKLLDACILASSTEEPESPPQ